MGKFTRLGFDLRVALDATTPTADALAWPEVAHALRAAVDQGLKQNLFELLDVDSPSHLAELRKIARHSTEPVVIIELAFLDVVAVRQPRFDCNRSSTWDLAPEDIAQVSYDVCDADGFFSIFEMGDVGLNRGDCSDDPLTDALMAAQAANFIVPSHSPFVVVRIRILANR